VAHGPFAPGTPATGTVTARLGAHTTTLECEPSPYLRLDAEGRWTAYGEGAGRFRRALDGRVLAAEGRGLVALSGRDAEALERRIEAATRALLERVRQTPAVRLLLDGSREELLRRLGAAALWTSPRRREDRLRFEAAWPEPALVLPPHRYRDLVVLPALGCPNHGCTFCAFYRDRRFRPLSDDAFEAHLDRVEAALGKARHERDGVFLGSASALSLPDAVLGRRLTSLASRWGRPRRGFASFLDADHAPRRDADAWGRLAAAGLGDVTLGLETGLPALRRQAGKSADVGAFAATVLGLKHAGLRVSITLLVGLGGEEAAAPHEEASVRALAGMALGAGDLVYLAPLAGAWAPARLEAAVASLGTALAGATPARVSPYRIERYAWLA
jgi:hypothetical protein